MNNLPITNNEIWSNYKSNSYDKHTVINTPFAEVFYFFRNANMFENHSSHYRYLINGYIYEGICIDVK